MSGLSVTFHLEKMLSRWEYCASSKVWIWALLSKTRVLRLPMRSQRRSKNSESQPQKSRLKPADYFPFSFHLFSDFYWSVRGIGFSLYRCWVAVVLVVSMGYLSSRIFHAGHYVDLMVTEQNWRFLFSPNNKTRLSSEWAQQTIQPRNMQMKQIFSMVKTQEMLQFSLMQRSSSFFMLMLFQCAPPRLL